MKIGISEERLYGIWNNMHYKCENQKSHVYANYGGRGISVCPEWDLYSKFCAWAWNSGYSDELSIDRIDVNGNYEPHNCRWASMKEKANHRIGNKYIEYNGEWLTAAEWAEITNVDKRHICKRISRGWNPEEAIGISEHFREKKINIRLRNQKWEYRFEAPKTKDGVRHQITKCGFPTKEEALEAGKRKFEEVYDRTVQNGGHRVDKWTNLKVPKAHKP